MRPTTTEVQELKLLVASRLDVTEFLDTLGWTMFELVEQLPNYVFDEAFEELMGACGEE